MKAVKICSGRRTDRFTFSSGHSIEWADVRRVATQDFEREEVEAEPEAESTSGAWSRVDVDSERPPHVAAGASCALRAPLECADCVPMRRASLFIEQSPVLLSVCPYLCLGRTDRSLVSYNML